MFRSIKAFLLFLFYLKIFLSCSKTKNETTRFYGAEHPYFHYVGRVDFSDKTAPRFWASGVYIEASFIGKYCELEINDEGFFKKSNKHNYFEIQIDSLPVKRIHLTKKRNKIILSQTLSNTLHTLTICKSTESKIGYSEFIGLRVKKLFPIKRKKRRIEFIGDSMTCGNGMDSQKIKCGERYWYDQHAAFESYGPLLARKLKSEWMLTSASGYGMTRSCCGIDKTIPEIYDYTDLSQQSIPWNKSRYRPDLISICLGQNDGKQNVKFFTSTYLLFLKKLRREHPKSTLLLIDSPMARESFKPYLDSMLMKIYRQFDDKNSLIYFYKKRYNKGCLGHPDKREHKLMAEELYGFLTRKGFE